MNKKLETTKNFVRTHIPHTVAAIAVVTTVGVIAYYDRKTLLELPTKQFDKLKTGGAVVYKVRGEDFILFHNDFFLKHATSN